MGESIEVSVCVPVFNQYHYTRTCIESLLAGTEGAIQLIVIDNHSSDDTPALLEAEFSLRCREKGWEFLVIRNDVNVGFGRAMNQGIRAARGKYVALVNNDTWISPGWNVALARRLRELGAGVVFPYMYEKPFDPMGTPTFADQFVRRYAGRFRREWRSVFMFWDRSQIVELGMFDERFFLTYEDTDLQERVHRAGIKYFTVGDAFVWHFGKGTRSQKNVPSDHEREGLRLFMEKWGFDPRIAEASLKARLVRKLTKIRASAGWF